MSVSAMKKLFCFALKYYGAKQLILVVFIDLIGSRHCEDSVINNARSRAGSGV